MTALLGASGINIISNTKTSSQKFTSHVLHNLTDNVVFLLVITRLVKQFPSNTVGLQMSRLDVVTKLAGKVCLTGSGIAVEHQEKRFAWVQFCHSIHV